MRTIVITNQKGGCGKTTTSLNLSAALAQMGQRVLLIDLDPQAHATLGLGYDPENLENTVYQVITNRRFSIAKAIIDTKIEGLHLAPSNIRLAKVEQDMNLVTQKEFILADQLKRISDKYDICIVDCPPSLGLLTFNALVASTDIIVPVQVHYYALEGLKQLLETVKIARKRFYPCSIKILGLLLTFVEDRAALSHQVEDQMKKFFGDLVFKTVIHRTISLAEAPSAGEPIITYAPESKGAVEYKALAQEVLDSDKKEQAKKPQDVENIVEQIQAADTKINLKSKAKAKKEAAKPAILKERFSEKKSESPGRKKEAQQYHIPKRKSNAGRMIFLLVLLAITIVVVVMTFLNTPPTAEPGQATVPEDTPTKITLRAQDKDRDELSYRIERDPEHGRLTGLAPNLTYTPDVDYIGPDSFVFSVSDGKADSNSVTVSIVVNEVDDAPVANDQEVTIKVDHSLPVTLTGKDSESESLTFSIVTEPSHGSIYKVPGFESSGRIVYTPEEGFVGNDSFAFIVTDGQLSSNHGIVQVNITQNNPPVADIETIPADEDTPVTILLKGEDPDGDTITYKIVSEPAHGELSGKAPNLTYTPNENFNGQDSFTYKTNDGKDDSFVATVSITVKSINDVPIAKPGSFTTQEDVPVPINLVASDPDGDPLSYEIVTPPSHGTLTQTAPNLIYTPASNYNGSDSFSYRADDLTGKSPSTEVSITIEPMEDAPVASSETSIVLSEDTPTTFTLKASDPDGDPITYTIERPPTYGVLSGTGPEFTYTPKKDFNFLDSFTFTVSDGKSKSSPAIVYITVNSVNDPPTANNDTAETFEDEPIEKINVLSNDTDEDKDPLTVKDVNQPAHGKAEINSDNTVKYTPDPNYYGVDRFTYTAKDPDGLTGTASVEVKIIPINDPPHFVSQPITTAMLGVLYVYNVKAIDPDKNDKLTYSLLTKPQGMTIGRTTGIIEWMPDDLLAPPSQVTIKVTDDNDIPAASTQTFLVKVVPTPSKIVTLSVTDGLDSQGKSIFSPAKDVNTVATSNNNYVEIKPKSSVTFDFSDVSLPTNTKITSLVIYVEHSEEDGFPSGSAKWSIGQNWPKNPDVWFTIDAPTRDTQKGDSMDSWDAASIVDTPEKMKNLQLQIQNNDNLRSIFIDYVYIIAQWAWPEASDLVEYKLEPVQ